MLIPSWSALQNKRNSCIGFQLFLPVMVWWYLKKNWQLVLAWRDLSQSKSWLPSSCLNLQTEITGVTTYFVNSRSVKENVPFLKSRFSYSSTFQGTLSIPLVYSKSNELFCQSQMLQFVLHSCSVWQGRFFKEIGIHSI